MNFEADLYDSLKGRRNWVGIMMVIGAIIYGIWSIAILAYIMGSW